MITDLSHVYKINAITSYFNVTGFTIKQDFITALDSISKMTCTVYLPKALLLSKPQHGKGK